MRYLRNGLAGLLVAAVVLRLAIWLITPAIPVLIVLVVLVAIFTILIGGRQRLS